MYIYIHTNNNNKHIIKIKKLFLYNVFLIFLFQDKKIEENKFIIQPKVHMKHKADQKPIPLKVETTINIVNTSLKNPNDNS